MRNLPTDLLRTFVTIVDLGSFSRAAEQLCRTQPAISLQLKRLQDLVGHKLISRQGQQLVLDAQGKLLYDHAQQILAINDRVVARLQSSSLDGTVRFGVPSEFASTLLHKVVGQFARAYPHVMLEVSSALSKDLLSPARRQRFDLILALHNSPEDAGNQMVKEVPLVWAGSDQTLLDETSEIPLVAAPEGCVYRDRAINSLTNHQLPWRMVYTNPDLTGISAAVQAGLGITPLALGTVPDALKVLKPSDRLPELGSVSISLVRPQTTNSEAAQVLADYVTTALA